MQTPLPLTRDVVLIGGGHTHALVLRRWAMTPLAGARVTLINPGPTAPYSGMLPGYIAGHYACRDLEIDLVRLARFAGARLVLDHAVGIDRKNQRVHLSAQADIAYDIASIDVGITTEIPGIPGFDAHALGAKPLARYAAKWEDFLTRVTTKALPPYVTIIGGGVAGIELALAMAHHLTTIGAKHAKVTVLEAANTPLNGTGKAAQRALLGHAKRLGVRIICGATATKIRADSVLLADGTEIPSTLTIGTATPRPHPWLIETGLANDNGFIEVDDTLRSSSDRLIYAAGDCAEMTRSPRPKAGVFAVRQAPVLYHNLRAEVTDTPRKKFRPQKSYLKLISTGGKGAVADKFGLRLDGGYLWKWKDHIDRKFMRKFDDLPEMPSAPLPKDLAVGVIDEVGTIPLCGGCGAKVGSAGLASVLAQLPTPIRDDVLSRPGDDAAILAHSGHQQVFTTDHLRAFMNDPYRMARIAANHALGDVLAMGAKPQAALASIILPRMSVKMQAETLREIMAAASETFRDAGAEVVGGHTSLGSELTIGFSVTGLTTSSPVQNTGARAGDVLILTKPIGSGTILAAEMRLLAQGEWVEAAYRMMEHPLNNAAGILAPLAHAMTDVTGFGLAGHLDVMARGSGLLARLRLDDIPLLEGAMTLAEQGVRSSIWGENRRAVTLEGATNTSLEALVFDPQTAGGLLAAVPPDQAVSCLEALVNAGEDAAIIGDFRKGSAGLSLI